MGWQEVGGWSYKSMAVERLASKIDGKQTVNIGGRLTPKTGGSEVETSAIHHSSVFLGLRPSHA